MSKFLPVRLFFVWLLFGILLEAVEILLPPMKNLRYILGQSPHPGGPAKKHWAIPL